MADGNPQLPPSTLDRDKLAHRLAGKTEFTFDPDHAEPVAHKWIDRGLKMTCEDAGHPYHEAWKQGGKPERMS